MKKPQEDEEFQIQDSKFNNYLISIKASKNASRLFE